MTETIEQEIDESVDFRQFFVPITKVDAQKREVYGFATVEEPDAAGEVMDYASSKPHFVTWSEGAMKRSGGKSKGNVRAMHSNIAAGKLVDFQPDDARKAVFVGAKVTNDNEWTQVEEGVYTGFSVGGRYMKRWYDGGYMRYTAQPTEISLVDSPAVRSATFQLIKADGAIEERPFRKDVPSSPSPTSQGVVDQQIQKQPEAFGTLTLNINVIPSTAELQRAGVPAQAEVSIPVLASPATDNSPAPKGQSEASYKIDENDITWYKTELEKAEPTKKPGEPKTPPKGYPTDKGEYADPKNFSWPVDSAKRCKAAMAYFNGGKGKDKYDGDEWSTIGRRIASACTKKLNAKYTFNASTSQVVRQEEKTKA